jgi:hypothetical protein
MNEGAMGMVIAGSRIRVRNNFFISDSQPRSATAVGMNGAINPAQIDISGNRFEGFSGATAGIIKTTPFSGVVGGKISFLSIDANEFFDPAPAGGVVTTALQIDADEAHSIHVRDNRLNQVKKGVGISANLYGGVVVTGNLISCLAQESSPGATSGVQAGIGISVRDTSEGAAVGDGYFHIKNNQFFSCQSGIEVDANSVAVESNSLLVDRGGVSRGIRVFGSNVSISSNIIKEASFGIHHQFPQERLGLVRFNSVDIASNRIETGSRNITQGGPECGRTAPASVGICLQGGDAGQVRRVSFNRVDGSSIGLVTNNIGDSPNRGVVQVFRNDILVSRDGRPFMDNVPGDPPTPFRNDLGEGVSSMRVDANEVTFFTTKFGIGPGSTFHADGRAEVGSLFVLNGGGNVNFSCHRETSSRGILIAELDPNHSVDCPAGENLEFGGVSCPQKYAVQSSGPLDGGRSGWEGRCRKIEEVLQPQTMVVWAYCCKK